MIDSYPGGSGEGEGGGGSPPRCTRRGPNSRTGRFSKPFGPPRLPPGTRSGTPRGSPPKLGSLGGGGGETPKARGASGRASNREKPSPYELSRFRVWFSGLLVVFLWFSALFPAFQGLFYGLSVLWPFGPPNNLRGGFPGPSGPQPILGLFFRALRAPKQSWGGFPGPSGPRPILGLFFRALRAPKQSQGRVSGPFGLPHNLRVGFPRPSGPQTILGLGFRTLRAPNQS